MTSLLISTIIVLLIIILLISNDYVIIAYNIHKKYGSSNGSLDHESFYVYPGNPIALYLITRLYKITKPIFVKTIDRYVTFTRLNLTIADTINCDYCSIANGLIRLIIDSVQYHMSNDMSIIAKVPIDNSIVQFLESGLSKRTKQITNLDVSNYVTNTFGECDAPDVYKRLFAYSKIYLLLEQIELRYCPFKAMSDYYRNADPRYLAINEDTIYQAGKILAQYETIECHLCAVALNQQMDKKFISDGRLSPMQEFYDFLRSF